MGDDTRRSIEGCLFKFLNSIGRVTVRKVRANSEGSTCSFSKEPRNEVQDNRQDHTDEKGTDNGYRTCQPALRVLLCNIAQDKSHRDRE